MKYTIIYGRRVRVKAFESMEIGLHMEFDSRISPIAHIDEAFRMVRNRVEGWIAIEQDRILAEHGKRPG